MRVTTHHISQVILNFIRCSLYSTLFDVVTARLYVGSPLSDCSPLCCGRTAPEVSEEEGTYVSRFYRWFLESSKGCLLLLPVLIDTLSQLLAWRSLLWLFNKWRRRYLTQSNFLSTASLARSLALHLLSCFSQEKPITWKEIHTHTYIHT